MSSRSSQAHAFPRRISSRTYDSIKWFSSVAEGSRPLAAMLCDRSSTTPWVMTMRRPPESPGSLTIDAEERDADQQEVQHRLAEKRSNAHGPYFGEYQIGDEPRSCVVIGTFGSVILILKYGVVCGPARRRDLEDARVVDRADRRIEVRVLPRGDEPDRRWLVRTWRRRRPPCSRRSACR